MCRSQANPTQLVELSRDDFDRLSGLREVAGKILDNLSLDLVQRLRSTNDRLVNARREQSTAGPVSKAQKMLLKLYQATRSTEVLMNWTQIRSKYVFRPDGVCATGKQHRSGARERHHTPFSELSFHGSPVPAVSNQRLGCDENRMLKLCASLPINRDCCPVIGPHKAMRTHVDHRLDGESQFDSTAVVGAYPDNDDLRILMELFTDAMPCKVANNTKTMLMGNRGNRLADGIERLSDFDGADSLHGAFVVTSTSLRETDLTTDKNSLNSRRGQFR